MGNRKARNIKANEINNNNNNNNNITSLTKTRSINLNYPKRRQFQGQNRGKCYISHFANSKKRNPTVNVNTCRNTYHQKCETSTMIPWKPRALRYKKNNCCR